MLPWRELKRQRKNEDDTSHSSEIWRFSGIFRFWLWHPTKANSTFVSKQWILFLKSFFFVLFLLMCSRIASRYHSMSECESCKIWELWVWYHMVQANSSLRKNKTTAEAEMRIFCALRMIVWYVWIPFWRSSPLSLALWCSAFVTYCNNSLFQQIVFDYKMNNIVKYQNKTKLMHTQMERKRERGKEIAKKQTPTESTELEKHVSTSSYSEFRCSRARSFESLKANHMYTDI